jgi:hypothetical protein
MPGILRLGFLLLLPAIIGALPALKEGDPEIGQEDFSFGKVAVKIACGATSWECYRECAVCPFCLLLTFLANNLQPYKLFYLAYNQCAGLCKKLEC